MSLWAPLEENNFKNPYPMYTTLRKKAPVYKAQTGEWIITRYDDVKSILNDKRFISGNKKDWVEKRIPYFKSKEKDFEPIAEAINTFLLFLNPPHHTKIRKLVASAWDDRNVDEIIKNNIELLLSKPADDFDIIKDYAQPLPAMTIARIMGIPLEDYEILRSKGNHLLKVLDLYISLKEMILVNDASRFFVDYFRNQIQKIRLNPNFGLISKIISKSKASDQSVTEEEIISLCIFLFLAGEETTVSLIGNGLVNLSHLPEERNLLIRNNELLDSGLEELLRFDSPVHLLGRIAVQDIRFRDQIIKKGDVCTLCIASANRDESVFESADNIVLDRNPNRHIAFGYGKHFCMGDRLAKKQGKMAIKHFIEKFPSYKIEMNTSMLNNNLSIRSYLSLKLQHP